MSSPPKVSYDMVQEKLKEVKTEKDGNFNKDFMEVIQGYELCVKAQIEKHNLEGLMKTLPFQKQAQAVQQINTISSILRSTRDRLRMNLSLSESKLRSTPANIYLQTYMKEIKEFLKDGSQVKQLSKQQSSIQSKQLSKIVSENVSGDNSFVNYSANQIVEYKSPQILDLAKNRVEILHSKRFATLNSQLDTVFHKQAFSTGKFAEVDQDDIFYQNVAKQLNQEAQKQTKIEAIEVEENIPISANKHRSSVDLASSMTRLDVIGDANLYFQQKAMKSRMIMKKASDQVFNKKFGNSLVKMRRERQINLQAYEQKLAIQLKQKMSAKLESQQLDQQTNQAVLNSQQSIRTKCFTKTDIQKQDDIEINSYILQRKQQTPKSLHISQLSRNVIFSQEDIGSFSPSSKISNTSKSMRNLNYLQQPAPKHKFGHKSSFMISPHKSTKSNPPSQIDSLKKLNSLFIVAANQQYKNFIEERDGIKQLIKSYKLESNEEMEKLQIRYNSYRRVDF